MKKNLFTLAFILFLTLSSIAQNNVGINDNSSSPNPAAVLDVFSSSKGLLIPRISLQSSTDITTIASPVASLLVYNTATVADITPGYYYWDGTSKWVRMIASSDPEKNYNTVSKTATTTLLKTENTILASGDITLTLPTVTNVDDGLEISVKNVGTFTDLITIIPEATKKIDANTSTTLTRWKGKTFIATGGNWVVKEKEARADNLLDVSESGSFTTIAEVIAFLNLHISGPTVVRLGGGTDYIASTQTINLAYPVTFEGISFGEVIIEAAAGVSGSPLFDCQTECYFKKLVFNAIANTAGNDAIHLSGSGTYYEIKDNVFVGFNKGVVSTTNTDSWIFENDFEDCPGAAIEIANGSANGDRLRISETDFVQCAKGINLLSGVAMNVSITNCSFQNTISGTDIGIVYTPASFTTFKSMFITNNTWNISGTFISGFDFARPDGRDADAFIINNAGMENKNPHCKINVNNNAQTTTIANILNIYHANWINGASSYSCNWKLEDNKITYQPKNVRDAWAVITGNILVNNANRVVTLAIFKNGSTLVRYGETDLRIITAGQPFQFSTVIYVPDLAKGDYLELGVTSSSNGDIVRFQDVQWFMNTQ